jgi:hypothetical protein
LLIISLLIRNSLLRTLRYFTTTEKYEDLLCLSFISFSKDKSEDMMQKMGRPKHEKFFEPYPLDKVIFSVPLQLLEIVLRRKWS